MDTFTTLIPSELRPSDTYDLMVSTIQPRPIAFVSTLDPLGRPNLAPFSFFMPGGANPPSLALSINLGTAGRRKDTLANIETTKEFVVNLVVRAMASGMNQASFSFPAGESEWPATGFTQLPSAMVAPPRVSESPAHYECRLFEIIHHGTESGAACYVIGEVVAIHIRSALWNGQLIPDALRPIARLGGPMYLDTESLERFSMERPKG